MDDQYHIYINRLMGMTRVEHYCHQLGLIQPSSKFALVDGQTTPTEFPGYSLTTPPGHEDLLNGVNGGFFDRLASVQEELWRICQPQSSQFMAALPRDTYHLTLADLIWDANYRQQLETIDNYEWKLRAEIGEILSQKANGYQKPIQLKVLGFLVMTRAIAVALAPNTEADYQHILDLRRAVYQHPPLLGLGVEQQYHFTGHITLGYFTQVPEGLDLDLLSRHLDRLNNEFLDGFPEFLLERVELRKFDNMTDFKRLDNWPTWSF